MRKIFLLILLIAVSYGVHISHQKVELLFPTNQELEKPIYLPPPHILKTSVLGFETIVADLVWLQVIQYYGGRIAAKRAMPELYQFFDVITTLDPDFIESYVFASFVLTDLDSTQSAEKILLKGLKQNPTSWVIPYQLGFVNYLYYKNDLKAAQYFEEAASLPDAPNHIARMAAQLYSKSGFEHRCSVAPRLWADAHEQAVDPGTKERSKKHLIELKMFCDISKLEEILQHYYAREKAIQDKLKPEERKPVKYPPSLGHMVKSKLIPEYALFDPLNRNYIYNSQTGQVQVKPLPWDKLVELDTEDIAK